MLREGETLSGFVEAAALQVARQRAAQDAFLARGRASLAKARETGEFYAVDDVLDQMEDRVRQRMSPGAGRRSASRKP